MKCTLKGSTIKVCIIFKNSYNELIDCIYFTGNVEKFRKWSWLKFGISYKNEWHLPSDRKEHSMAIQKEHKRGKIEKTKAIVINLTIIAGFKETTRG